PRERYAEESDLAVARGKEADDGIHARGLAGAVATEQGQHAPAVQRERHRVQDVTVGIECVDAGEHQRLRRHVGRGFSRERSCSVTHFLNARQFPRYTSRVFGSATTSLRVPSTITLP